MLIQKRPYSYLLTILFVFITGCVQPAKEVQRQNNEDSVHSYNQLEAEVKELAKPAYIRAYTAIHELLIDANLADSGLLKKADVLTHYNQSVGPIMGREYDFDKMKIRLLTAGDAYIKVVFDKEVARIATEKAAEAEFQKK